MVALNDPNLHSKFHVSPLIVAMFQKKIVRKKKISLGHIEAHPSRKGFGTANHFSPFKAVYEIQPFKNKSKNCQIFLVMEPESINLPTINSNKAVWFCHPQPLSQFQVANFSHLKVIGEKSFFMWLVGWKVAEKCNTKTLELRAMRAESLLNCWYFRKTH